MREIVFKDEIDALYITSNKLTQAETPHEQLEAISSYARSAGADGGVLMYLDEAGITEEVVAEWTNGPILPFGIGTLMSVSVGGFARYWMTLPVRTTFVSDVSKDTRIDQLTLETLQRHKTRALVILPLYNKERWIAAILFSWSAPTLFDERDQRVYTALQQQAASVIDSVRLLEQTQKRALELETTQREMDIVYSALRRLTRATTRKELLEGVSDYPREKGAFNGQLFYFTQPELDRVETVATWGTAPDVETPIGFVIDLMQRPFTRYWFSQPEVPTLVSDLMSSDLVDPTSRQIFTDLHTRAIAVLPLHTNGRWVGVITFYWDHVYNFDDRDRRIFTALQQQLAPAIESVRQFEQSQQRATELEIAKREMDILYSASRKLMQAASPAEQLEAVSDYARANGADAGALSYFPDSVNEEEVVAEWTTDNVLPVGVGTRFYVTPTDFGPVWGDTPGQPTLISDPDTDSRVTPHLLPLMEKHKTQSVAFLPLHNKGRWIGLLVFRWGKPYNFNERDYRVYAALQQQTAPVVDSVRLFKQAEKLAALEERTRLARELHDSVSQALYGIGLGARTARALLAKDPARLTDPLDYILSLAEAGLTEMRALIFELRPESLEQEGIITALGKQATSVQARYAINVTTEFSDEPDLPLETKDDLYRIAREALHNAVKHAKATQVRLSLVQTPQGYQLEVADNGVGFDPNGSFPGHLGLKSMRERTASLKGTYNITSTPGQGTCITVTIAADVRSRG